MKLICISSRNLADLRRELLDVLDDVDVVVAEFDPMRRRVEALIEELQINAPEVEQLKESLEFLRWIHNGYFTFTGCVEFDLKNRWGQILSQRSGWQSLWAIEKIQR